MKSHVKSAQSVRSVRHAVVRTNAKCAEAVKTVVATGAQRVVQLASHVTVLLVVATSVQHALSVTVMTVVHAVRSVIVMSAVRAANSVRAMSVQLVHLVTVMTVHAVHSVIVMTVRLVVLRTTALAVRSVTVMTVVLAVRSVIVTIVRVVHSKSAMVVAQTA